MNQKRPRSVRTPRASPPQATTPKFHAQSHAQSTTPTPSGTSVVRHDKPPHPSHDPANTQTKSAPHAPVGKKPSTATTGSNNLDIGVAGALAVLAAAAAFTLPDGNAARMVFTLSVLLVVPGYLLIQAVVGQARSTPKRMIHVLLSLGLSPAIVGLLALATATIPGGFQAPWIIALVTLWCVAMTGLAFWRRKAHLERAPASGGATVTV